MVENKNNRVHDFHLYVPEAEWQKWVDFRNTKHGKLFPMTPMIRKYVNEGIARANKRGK